MPKHWTEANKHKAKEAFDSVGHDIPKEHSIKHFQRPPQPMLTPKGQMRRSVDQRIREKQEAIKAKFALDRQMERDR